MKKFLYVFSLLLVAFTGAIAQKTTDKPAEKAAEKPVDPFNSGVFSALNFRSIGPAVTSGRIADFAVNPKKTSEYYVAAAAGGVWKTTNNGVTYAPIFDGQGSYSIGCVSLDPNNAATVWVGTGENNNQRSLSYGDGVYKSEDAGKSWKNMGLKNSEHIAEIIVDPTDANIVYVAAYGPVWNEGGDRGVYKSTDGGATWNCVKAVSAYTGCNDLVMDPRNPKILYAAFHQRMRKVFTYIGGGPESAIYKTVDGGATWKKLEGGLPGGDIGRMGLAISKVNPDVLYTVVEAQDDKGGIYRSVDKGASWEKRNPFFTSGNYYQEIECDPINVDKIYITDTYYKISTDGGKTVSNLGEINKHIDNHAIWVDPSDGNHLLVGCDGGVYETYDHAKSWDYKSNLPVTQFYKVSTDNDYPFYHVHGGTQDNFSLGGPSRTISGNGVSNAEWYVTSTGDGFETQVDQSNPDIIYAQSQYGGLNRYDRKSGESVFIKPIEGEDEANRWNWDAPLLISQFDNSRLYFGANKVYRTDDKGNSWKAISPDLTRQIDRNKLEIMGKVWSVDAIAKNGSTDIYGQTTSIAESKLDQNMLWVGTDDGLVQLTTDGGKNWTKIDNIPGAPAQSYVHQVIASLHDKNTAYVCFNHHRYGDFKPYLFKTSDAGKTWKAIQNNLPVRGSLFSIAEDHVDANLLFVGTEFGIFFSNNGGENWIQLKSGLPAAVAVRDIELQRRENDVVIATFGRGFYILENYSALRTFKKADLDKAAILLPVKDALMYNESFTLGLRDKGHLGSSYYNVPNPKPGAVFTYYLKDDVKKIKDIRKEAEKVKFEKGEKVYYPSMDSLRLEDNQVDPYLLFTITDEQGEVVRHMKAPAKKGLQKVTWNFLTNPASPVNQRFVPAPDQLFGGEELGYMVMPGKYQVVLQKYQDGVLTTLTDPVTFNCKLLNNTTLPSKNRAADVAFAKKASTLRKAISAAADVFGNMDTRLKNINLAIQDMPAPTKELLKQAYDVSRDLQQISLKMYGDNTKSRREFETTPSISDRVFGIMGAISNSTAEVPKSYVDSYEIASKQLKTVVANLKSTNQKIEAIEKELDMKNAPHSPGRWPNW